MLRILIADDHDFIRQGIRLILTEEFPLAYFEEAEDAPTLVNKVIGSAWDIVLSDISMPGGGGLAALEEFSRRELNVRVLIVSMFPSGQYALRARKAGAKGYVSKDTVTEHLLPAVHTVLAGHEYFS